MKKIVGLVVILAVLILGSYYGTGMITERKVRETVKVINQNNGIYAEIKSYSRGWFHSTASIDWNLQIPERVIDGANAKPQTIPAQKYEISMPLAINHGPFIFSDSGMKFGVGFAKTDLDLPPKYVKQFDSLFTADSTKPQVDLGLFVNYLLKSRITLAVPEFKLVAKKGSGQLTWEGMDTSVSMNSDLSNIDGDFTVNGMSFSQDGKKVTIDAITSSYDLKKSVYGLFTGSASLSFPSMVVTNQGAKIFELDDLSMKSNSDISGKTISSSVSLTLDALMLKDQKYGPGSFELAIRNLDAQAMGRINELSSKLQNGKDDQKQQAMMQLLQELPALASQGPEIEISQMTFKLPDGKVEGTLLLSLPKIASANIMSIVQSLNGTAHFEVPRALVQMAAADTFKKSIMNNQLQQAMAQQNQGAMSVVEVDKQAQAMAEKRLNAMVESGMFVAKDKELIVDLRLEQGKLMVNGKPFHAGMLKF